MHLNKGTLLVIFVCESIITSVSSLIRCGCKMKNKVLPDESVASGDTGDRVEHDLSTLAAEERTNEARLPVVSQAEYWVAEHGDEV